VERTLALDPSVVLMLRCAVRRFAPKHVMIDEDELSVRISSSFITR